MTKKQYIKMTDFAHNYAIEAASNTKHDDDYGVVFNAAYDAFVKGYEKGFINEWTPIEQSLPKDKQTVWLSNGKGWTTLGCLIETETGYHWAESNGIIYQEGNQIVSECYSDDLDVEYWSELPTPTTK